MVAYIAIAAGWAASIWLSTLIAAPPWLHAIALFVHLASLIVGFGAVLVVEWYGFLWMTEWRSVRDLRQVDLTLKLPIWAGLIGLLASGALLQPDLTSPATLVKLGAVLVLSLNGVATHPLDDVLRRIPAEDALRRAAEARARAVHHERDRLADRLVDRRDHRHDQLHVLTGERVEHAIPSVGPAGSRRSWR